MYQLSGDDDFALDISHLILEDEQPVDNFQSEKQQRLLVDPLYSSQVLPPPYVAAANVGIFYAIQQDPIVPDAFLSLGVEMPNDWSQKQNRSYFVWEFGKVPEVCIEIVSNQKGNELKVSSKHQTKKRRKAVEPDDEPKESKKNTYARIGVPYYVVCDPLRQIQDATQMNGELLRVWLLNAGRYVELDPPFWLDSIELGLMLWEGEFEGASGTWLRWCDRQQQPIPTGKERAEQERQRAEQERQRAEQERQRAEQERQRAERLAERLRVLGIDPDEV
jgi:Putative restriction endonuclease